MKVDGNKCTAGVAPKTPPAQEGKSGPKSKAFSKILDEKSEKKKAPGDPLDFADEAALAAFSPVLPQPQQFPAEIKDSQSVRPGLDAALVRDLVQEITVVTQVSGAQSVDVQFNSRTLQNLQVRISKDGDNLSIRFSAPNEAISKLLSRNVDQLSSALAAKGVLAVVEIQVGAPPPMSDDTPPSSGERRHDQRQDRQQKQQR